MVKKKEPKLQKWRQKLENLVNKNLFKYKTYKNN